MLPAWGALDVHSVWESVLSLHHSATTGKLLLEELPRLRSETVTSTAQSMEAASSEANETPSSRWMREGDTPTGTRCATSSSLMLKVSNPATLVTSKNGWAI